MFKGKPCLLLGNTLGLVTICGGVKTIAEVHQAFQVNVNLFIPFFMVKPQFKYYQCDMLTWKGYTLSLRLILSSIHPL